MFSVNDDMSIYVTRGDVVFFTVTADDNGKGYTFNPGDVVRLKITEKKASESVVLQKDFPVTEATEAVQILLTGDETKFGEVISKPTDYWYEIELNPHTNPQTILGYDEDGAKIFKLFPEGNDMEPTPIEPEDIPVVDEELSLTSDRPVQNQAVARAVLGLDDKISATNTRFNLLCTLKEGSTTGDAELADIRIGVDGTVYGSAGEAVRDQVSDLKNILLQHEADFYGPIQEAKEAATSAKTSEENTVENAQKAQEAAESILGVEENVRSLEQNIEEFAERAEDAAGVAQAVAQFEIDAEINANSYNPIANKAVTEEFAKYLPLSGGTATNFTVGTNGSIGVPAVKLLNSDGTVAGYFGMSYGALRKWDTAFKPYEVLDTGNMANHVLPLSGGTVNSSSRKAMSVNNTTGTASSIGFESMGTLLGELGASNSGAFFRDSSGTTQTLLHTGNMANHVLPLTGGEVNGNITQVKYLSSDYVYRRIQSPTRSIFERVAPNGQYCLYDDTNGKYIIESPSYGNHVFNGTASGITNGKLTKTLTIEDIAATVLMLVNSGADSTYMQFRGKNGALGFIGFGSENTPIVIEKNASTVHHILHTGNSAKVHIGTSAPSDTSALWIDTSA